MAIIYVTGRSCSGKDSLRAQLLTLHKLGFFKKLELPCMHTTRPAREYENFMDPYFFEEKAPDEEYIKKNCIGFSTYTMAGGHDVHYWYDLVDFDPSSNSILFGGMKELKQLIGIRSDVYVVVVDCDISQIFQRAAARSDARNQSEMFRRLVDDEAMYGASAIASLREEHPNTILMDGSSYDAFTRFLEMLSKIDNDGNLGIFFHNIYHLSKTAKNSLHGTMGFIKRNSVYGAYGTDSLSPEQLQKFRELCNNTK